MKRERDSADTPHNNERSKPIGNSGTNSNSVASRHFELIKGLTRRRAEGFAKDRAQDIHASPCEAGDQTSPSYFLPSISSVANVSALHTPFMALVDYLCDTLDDGGAAAAAASGDGGLDPLNLLPASIETVQFVANDGGTLVCTRHDSRSNSNSSISGKRGSSSAPTAIPVEVVDKELGERLIPGDVVLVYERARWSEHRPSSPDPPEEIEHIVVKQTRIELLGLNPTIFTEASAWAEAVQRNTLAVLQWQSTLLSHPPGLAQLTFLYQCATGGHRTPGRAGWVRALHLPLLSSTAVVESLPLGAREEQLLQRHRRVVLSTLLILSLVMKHAPSIIPLPHLIQIVLQEFIASPLFIDGFALVISLQAPMFLSAFEIQRVVEALRDVLRVGLQVFARPNVCAGWHHTPSAAAAAVSAPADAAALGSLFHVVHRLASVGLPLVSANHNTGGAAGDAPGASHPLREPLEDLVRSGLTAELLDWLREQEELENREKAQEAATAAGSSSTAETTPEEVLPRAHLPPTLSMIRQQEQASTSGSRHPSSRNAGGGNRAGAMRRSLFDATPYLGEMQRTYDPYRTKEALRFVEAATMAAFAELYGPAVRAVGSMLRHCTAVAAAEEEGVGSGPATKGRPAAKTLEQGVRENGASVIPLSGAQQWSPASAELVLDDLPLTTLRCLSRYGLPLRLSLDALRVDPVALTRLQSALAVGRTTNDEKKAVEEEREKEKQTPGILFCATQRMGYVVVHLQPTVPVVFPVLVTGLTTESDSTEEWACTVYPMRDGDLLTQFVSLAQLAASGTNTTTTTAGAAFSTGAWLVLGEVDAEDHHSPENAAEVGGGSGGMLRRTGGFDAEDPFATPVPRLFPMGTPAITYIDIIHRLQCIRRELQRTTSSSTTMSQTSASSSFASTPPTTTTAFAESAMGLWLSYFSTDVLPTQRHFNALLPSTRVIVTGAGAAAPATAPGRRDREAAADRLETILEELSDVVPFSHWQTEALRSLADGAVGTTTSRVAGHAQVLSSLRVLQGATGSGKTSLLHAAGLCKGRQVAAARREQQRGLKVAMQNATTALQQVINSILSARTLDELYEGGVGGNNTSSNNNNNNNNSSPSTESTTSTISTSRPHGFSREIEGLLTAAATQVAEYQSLAQGLQHCGTPLIVRADMPSCAGAGASTGREEGYQRLLFGTQEEEATGGNRSSSSSNTRPNWLQASSMTTLQAVAQEAVSRSSNAPLGKLLAQRLEDFSRVAHICSAILDNDTSTTSAQPNSPEALEEVPPLYCSVLPFLFSPQDRQDLHATAQASGMRWSEYLSNRLWAGVACRGGEAVTYQRPVSASNSAYLAMLEWKASSATGYKAVRGPDCGLARLPADQAAGWHAVFRSKQREWVQLVLGTAQEELRRTLVLFEELGYSVGALSQTGRYTALTATPTGLLRHGVLPFLWRWSPPHLLLDDFDAMTDGLFLTLPAASTVTVASLLYSAPLAKQRRSAPRAILSDLLHAMQKVSTTAVRTSVLRQLHRCRREEVHALLREYGGVGSRSANNNAGSSLAMLPAASNDEPRLRRLGDHHHNNNDDDNDGDDDNDNEEDGAADFGRLRPLPGLASLSAVEGWTHAVSAVEQSVEADIWAARHLVERFHQHPKAMRHRRRIAVYFPFPADRELAARMFAADEPSAPSRTLVLRCLPFQDPTASTGLTAAADEEVDIAILCVSGLLTRLLTATTAASGGSGRNRSSTQTPPWWERPEAAPDGVLEQRMECWLWRVLTRVRWGAVVIGDRRLFARLPSLRYLENFIGERRKSLSALEEEEEEGQDGSESKPAKPGDDEVGGPAARAAQEKAARAYWLPPEVGCAVMAFQCPQHYKSRFIAAIDGAAAGAAAAGSSSWTTVRNAERGAEAEEAKREQEEQQMTDDIFEGVQASPSGIRIALRGSTTCRALCLLPYKHCHCQFHACLRPCHESLPLGHTAVSTTTTVKDSTSVNLEAEADPLQHACCPFPCIRTLPGCGHLCTQQCGERAEPARERESEEDQDEEHPSSGLTPASSHPVPHPMAGNGAHDRPCPPCQVEGLTQLPCGQRVVSGTTGTGRTVQYSVFPHFQRRRCSAPPAPCDTSVKVTCRRCGTASTIQCAVLQGIKAQRREEERRWAAARSVPSRADEEMDGDTEDLLFRMVDCRGCVAVVNRIAVEVQQAAAAAGGSGFDFTPLPVPPSHWDKAPPLTLIAAAVTAEATPDSAAASNEGTDSEGAEAAARRRETAALKQEVAHLFASAPSGGRERLEAAFTHEALKASLVRLKEALEISNGKATVEHSAFLQGQEALKAQRALMEEERQMREASVQHADEQLVQKLREEVERQTALQEALDGAMGLLESEATEELERQRSVVDF